MAKKWKEITPEEGDVLIELGVPVQYRYKKGRGHAWLDAVVAVLRIRHRMVENWKINELGRYRYKGTLIYQELQVRVEIDA